MDVSKLTAAGWTAKIALRDGVQRTYASFLAESAAGSVRG
jgi:GDP-L-fucose synthase